jgi:hypothetical protein
VASLGESKFIDVFGMEPNRRDHLRDIDVNGVDNIKIYFKVVEWKGRLTVTQCLRHCNKPECRGIDSRWCHWNFSLT